MTPVKCDLSSRVNGFLVLLQHQHCDFGIGPRIYFDFMLEQKVFLSHFSSLILHNSIDALRVNNCRAAGQPGAIREYKHIMGLF